MIRPRAARDKENPAISSRNRWQLGFVDHIDHVLGHLHCDLDEQNIESVRHTRLGQNTKHALRHIRSDATLSHCPRDTLLELLRKIRRAHARAMPSIV